MTSGAGDCFVHQPEGGAGDFVPSQKIHAGGDPRFCGFHIGDQRLGCVLARRRIDRCKFRPFAANPDPIEVGQASEFRLQLRSALSGKLGKRLHPELNLRTDRRILVGRDPLHLRAWQRIGPHARHLAGGFFLGVPVSGNVPSDRIFANVTIVQIGDPLVADRPTRRRIDRAARGTPPCR